MTDVKKLAEQAGMNVSLWNYGAGSIAFTMGTEGVARGAVERFAALILEAAAVECDRLFNAPESEGGCGGYESYYTRPFLECAEAIRAMKPKGQT